MRAYLAIKYHHDGANRPRIERVSDALAQCGWETYCVFRDLEEWGAQEFDPETLMQLSFAAIDRCDMVVVELTEKGVGLGIEAGYAYGKGIPVLTVAEAGADISTTLRGISKTAAHYSDLEELKQVIGAFTRKIGHT